jgi:hypothetical protein
MKVQITTAFFEILAILEIKRPKQKKKSSAPRKSKAQSISQTTFIINQN